MYTALRFFSVLALGLSLLVTRPAHASHIVGGDISYQPLGNNRYRVTVAYFRDCTGIALPASLPLVCRNGSCNAASVNSTLSPIGVTTYSSPYNTFTPAMCTGSSSATITGYQLQSFTGTVTLPPGQWMLSVDDSARPNTANLTTQSSFRFEATLDNRTGLVNTSPVFSTSALFGLPVNVASIAQMGAFDADGDSLVYSLVGPLESCGTYNAYKTQPAPCRPVTTGPCALQCAVSSTSYTPTFPIAVGYDTVGTCPTRTLQPRFEFDAATGGLMLTPNRYINTPSVNGDNKYAVAVKVSEYRRINGAYVNIGSVRRDLMLTVFPGGSIPQPRMAPTMAVQQGPTAPITTTSIGQIIPALSGESVTVTLTGTSSTSAALLFFDLAYNAVPGAVIRNNSSGTVQLVFTPPLNLPNGIHRVSVQLKDYSNSFAGFEIRSIAFRVYGATLAARTAHKPTIAAWPNPFTESIQFQLPKPTAQTLTITDNLGRTVGIVRSQADGLVRWQPGTEVPAGLYLARTADGQQTVRLLRSAE